MFFFYISAFEPLFFFFLILPSLSLMKMVAKGAPHLIISKDTFKISLIPQYATPTIYVCLCVCVFSFPQKRCNEQLSVKIDSYPLNTQHSLETPRIEQPASRFIHLSPMEVFTHRELDDPAGELIYKKKEHFRLVHAVLGRARKEVLCLYAVRPRFKCV